MNKGLLLVNLGSPDSTRVKDVRRYLREFLMDGKVIDVPFMMRKIIVELFILPLRPKKSAAAYHKIWWPEGSPLVVISNRLTEKIKPQLDIPVELGMRYGNPSIKHAIQNLANKGVDEIMVLPLYPQYAMSTTETVVDKIKRLNNKYFKSIKFYFTPPFYADIDYLNLLAEKIKKHLPSSFDALLFSYHGIPERHIYKTDKSKTCEIGNCCFKDDSPSHATCYRHQCYMVTDQIKERLSLPESKVYQTFQSRLGRDPWLQPYTDKFLEEAGIKGKNKIVVVAPVFVADCLETLEELSIDGKEQFLEHGGKEFTYVPCLNDDDEWANLIVKWTKSWTQQK